MKEWRQSTDKFECMTRRVWWVTLYAVAMAFVESAGVGYLRALHPATHLEPLSVVAAALQPHLIAIEMGREAATIVMLSAVAALAGRSWWERLLYFAIAFGAWDILYYVWLWVLIGWPPSLLTWDVLFLLPVPWLAPVLAPVIVSVCLITGAVWLLRSDAGPLAGRSWAGAGLGAMRVLLSFTLDYRVVVNGLDPPGFRWWLFGLGVVMGMGAVVVGGERRE